MPKTTFHTPKMRIYGDLPVSKPRLTFPQVQPDARGWNVLFEGVHSAVAIDVCLGHGGTWGLQS